MNSTRAMITQVPLIMKTMRKFKRDLQNDIDDKINGQNFAKNFTSKTTACLSNNTALN